MHAIKEKNNSATADREIVHQRLLDAPRELVWEAFTDPAQVAQWWGPRGFTTTIHEMDLRPGGVWHHTMHGPDGTDYPNKSVFVEVVKPERIVYTLGGGREGAPGVSFEATWTFEEQPGDKTLLTGRMVFPTAAARDLVVKEYGAIEGGKQTLDRLEEQLEAVPVVVERTYDAPVETVWAALTEPAQMKQWYFTEIESFKPEVGFETQVNVRYRGREFLHLWKVTEAVPNKKIAYSWRHKDLPGDSIVSFELFPEGGKTRLKLTHTGLETFEPKKHPAYARKNHLQGWTHFGTALAEYLQTQASAVGEEFVIVRRFDAPRELVWKVYTEPEHLKHWWGPKGMTMSSCKVDLRPGGLFHYGMKTPDGHEMWGKFVYREIVPPEKLVFVVSFSDAQGGTTRHPMAPTWPLEMLNTITFMQEQDGITKVVFRAVPVNATAEERKTFKEGHKSMQQGFTGTLDQLTAYLASLPR
jgi:uncharacterized protein YndB with AHSA1/START domain